LILNVSIIILYVSIQTIAVLYLYRMYLVRMTCLYENDENESQPSRLK